MTRDRAQIVLDWLAAHGPAHVYDLAMHMGLQPDTMRKSIDRLRHEGRIHVGGWARVVRQQAKLWAAGPGTDAPKPAPRGRRPDHGGDWATAETAARMLERLTCGPGSVKTLAADCSACMGSIRRHLRDMHAARVVHIAEWRRATGVGGHFTVIWGLGPEPDATRPRARSKKQNYQAWRKRKIEKYGYEAAQLMLRSRRNGGAERIIIDGKQAYQRGGRPGGQP